jgi:hypothetical protein
MTITKMTHIFEYISGKVNGLSLQATFVLRTTLALRALLRLRLSFIVISPADDISASRDITPAAVIYCH